MLLNEFLKEHRKNEEQEATIAQLKSGIEVLTATVKEQAPQIQKVSAQRVPVGCDIHARARVQFSQLAA